MACLTESSDQETWTDEAVGCEEYNQSHSGPCEQSRTRDTEGSRITRPRPRPWPRRGNATITTSMLLSTALLAFMLCAPTSAGMVEMRNPTLFGRSEGIIFDPRPVPEPALFRRKVDSSSTDSSASTTSIETAPTSSDTPLPKAFDGGLGTNYTQQSCPLFLSQMLSNQSFISCSPVSLLLQNSQSYFQASRSVASITPVLDASCNVVFPVCSNLMSSFALTLRSSAACAQDYDHQMPLVRQAYNGLLAYNTLYHASCLKSTPSPSSPDKDNNNNNNADYCYADAVTNTSSPTDSYPYYLPLGISLPAGSSPTCSQCLKTTMALFAADASNQSQPLSLTYVTAATQINLNCGPAFVNTSVPDEGGSGKKNGAVASGGGALGLVGWLMVVVVGVAVA